jgi:hypothetical protein
MIAIGETRNVRDMMSPPTTQSAITRKCRFRPMGARMGNELEGRLLATDPDRHLVEMPT